MQGKMWKEDVGGRRRKWEKRQKRRVGKWTRIWEVKRKKIQSREEENDKGRRMERKSGGCGEEGGGEKMEVSRW